MYSFSFSYCVLFLLTHLVAKLRLRFFVEKAQNAMTYGGFNKNSVADPNSVFRASERWLAGKVGSFAMPTDVAALS